MSHCQPVWVYLYLMSPGGGSTPRLLPHCISKKMDGLTFLAAFQCNEVVNSRDFVRCGIGGTDLWCPSALILSLFLEGRSLLSLHTSAVCLLSYSESVV